MAKFSGSHTINCFCPGCNYSVTGRASSDKSQADADDKAESSATSQFANHNCPCNDG